MDTYFSKPRFACFEKMVIHDVGCKKMKSTGHIRCFAMVLLSIAIAVGCTRNRDSLEGVYRRDRWGEGHFAHLLVSPRLHKKLEPFEGQNVKVEIRKIRMLGKSTLDPRTLWSIGTITRTPAPALELAAKLQPEHQSSLTPFTIEITITNAGAMPIIVSDDCVHVCITGEAQDPFEIQKHWSYLWGGYSQRSRRQGIALISTSGYLNQEDGFIGSPSKIYDIPLGPGGSYDLTLPFLKGLPKGKYEVALEATSRIDKAGSHRVPSKTWLTFEIGDKTANQ